MKASQSPRRVALLAGIALASVLAASLALAAAAAAAAASNRPPLPECLANRPTGVKPPQKLPQPSAMGALFLGLTPLPPGVESLDRPTLGGPPAGVAPLGGAKTLAQGEIDLTPGAPRFQSETTIAATGNLVVVGFNDANGFSSPAGISVSGFAFSSDGGSTYTYGGQLPVAGGGDAVQGDPDIKYWINPSTSQVTFVYSSLYKTAGGQNSICVHVSTNGGVSWVGPRTVTPATSGTAFPDKEFIDVDPETGRILLTWTNFGTTVTMRSTTSDDFGLTWSAPVTFAARPTDGQGTCPRFDAHSGNAYVVWHNYSTPESLSFVRSTDNGNTWTAPANIVSGVVEPPPAYGSDRNNGFPILAVSPFDGSLHMVYASEQTADLGDIYYSRSVNAGATWTTPVTLNSSPGNDGAQFFPWVSINQSGTQRIDVTWYDQRAAAPPSDLTEIAHVHSFDGGVTWTAPASLTFQPFHAEYGQDTGRPNLGDYSQCYSLGTSMISSYARTDVADWQTTMPDAFTAKNLGDSGQSALEIASVGVVDSGCRADGVLVAGETGNLTITLRSSQLALATGISGTLTTTTPGVTVLTTGSMAFSDIGPNATGANTTPFQVQLAGNYTCGTPIAFTLQGTASTGPWIARFEQPTGVSTGTTTLLSENFDSVPSGLPAGWTWTQITGASNPWQVSTAHAASGTQSLFCADPTAVNRSRVETPALAVPLGTTLVEADFKITYDCEAVGDGRQGYDGTLLKVNIDGVDVLAGAFATLFQGQYPMIIVESSGTGANPLTDLSAWSGTTLPNFQNVRIQWPGLAGHTIKLAFEMGADQNTGATGFFVDDVQVSAIPLGCGTCNTGTALSLSPSPLAFPAVPGNTTSCLPVTISNLGTGSMTVNSVTFCNRAPFSLDLTGMLTQVPALSHTTFNVCVTPTAQGPDTCSVVVNTSYGTQSVLAIYDEVTGVEQSEGVPRVLTVAPARPNPFNPHVNIHYGLPRSANVTASVFDLAGRKVRDILSGEPQTAGFHDLVWDGRDARGALAPSGVYMFRVVADGASRVVRGVMVR